MNLLLEENVDLSVRYPCIDNRYDKGSEALCSPLFQVFVKENDVCYAMIKTLISHGADVNSQNNGITFLSRVRVSRQHVIREKEAQIEQFNREIKEHEKLEALALLKDAKPKELFFESSKLSVCSGYIKCNETINKIISEMMNVFYSNTLFLMKEPKLSDEKTNEVLRFLYSPAFHDPVVIKIFKDDSGKFWLKYKKMLGFLKAEIGYELIEKQVEISLEDWDNLFEKVNKMDFYNLPNAVGENGFDGAEWIVEVKKEGKYHFITRWSPKNDKKVFSLGELLKKMSGEDFELY